MTYQTTQTFAGKGNRDDQFTRALRGLAVDSEDRLYAVGDEVVKVFDAAGSLLGQWPTGVAGYSVAVAGDEVWVGQAGQVEIFSTEGRLRDTWRDGERLGLVTAIGFAGDDVLLADAAARCIRHFERGGRFLNNIGDQHRKGGFHIPNGVVDFAVDAEGVVHVANPGMHRVESYKPDGELLGRFGRFDGVDPAGFPGCCNPTNVALGPSDVPHGDRGRVFVTEKAGPRAKVYDAEGTFLEVIAAEEAFDATCKNMDLAIDSRGRVYVADTVRLQILVFEPADAA